MSTKAYYARTEIGPNKVGFPRVGTPVTNTRAIIEAAFTVTMSLRSTL